MTPVQQNEAQIVARNILVVLSEVENEELIKDFFGTVVSLDDLPVNFSGKQVYLCGDVSKAGAISDQLDLSPKVFIIEELSSGFSEVQNDWSSIDLGRVPISINEVGVFYPRFFDVGADYFQNIEREHQFQSLTESTKAGKAHRTGIYLSPVKYDSSGAQFNLLRCSTNLSGPTENFRATDIHIVDALNQESKYLFENPAPLNHVLAQIYHNTPASESKRETKAKIKSHADKTKDMPENGVMAFCTFYDDIEMLQPIGNFDYGRKRVSGLNRLCFRLKESVAETAQLPAKFSITLYPGSVFFMPLSTNRYYTHEIRASALNAEFLPNRLGYVVRCSKTTGSYKDGETFFANGSKLEAATEDGIEKLRHLYAKENSSDEIIEYGNQFSFSMNKGDYLAPDYCPADEFRVYELEPEANIFEQLSASVNFEDLGKGRTGTVLTKPHTSRGIPIVRTTSRFESPAQHFTQAHLDLAKQIENRASLTFDLNNALIEIYTNAYAKMGFHSDQALDLEEESTIALFSCYQYPELATPPRTLVVEPKDEIGFDPFEIPLTPNSLVVFSVDTNRRFKHKIVLNKSTNPPKNQWLGITFRSSKTFVQQGDKEQPQLENGKQFVLADESQQREFFKLRSRENSEADFRYPELNYTISESDLRQP